MVLAALAVGAVVGAQVLRFPIDTRRVRRQLRRLVRNVVFALLVLLVAGLFSWVG